MHDRAWSERGRRPRGEWGRGKRKYRDCNLFRAAFPLARSSLSITVDEKGKGLHASVERPSCFRIQNLVLKPGNPKLCGLGPMFLRRSKWRYTIVDLIVD